MLFFKTFKCCSEILYEDKNFGYCELAALVASKVYYHLGAFEESLSFALGAGNVSMFKFTLPNDLHVFCNSCSQSLWVLHSRFSF